jgi:hypothetical protein
MPVEVARGVPFKQVSVLQKTSATTEDSMTDSSRDSLVKTIDPQNEKPTTTDSRRDELDELDAADDAPGAGDVSPHVGRRAQPGDILGLETGGETTSIGDTSEDENKRRHDLEKDVAEDIKKRRDEDRR